MATKPYRYSKLAVPGFLLALEAVRPLLKAMITPCLLKRTAT